MASLDELTLWWCKNGHWLATAFSTLKILMADTPNRGAVDANNAGLCSAEFPDALGKADTVPWRKKDRWRCKQQHYHTSWNLLAVHCLILHRRIQPCWLHGGTIGQCWMLGLGCPGCPFLYSEQLWKELWIQMALSVRFSLRTIQRLYGIVSIESWPYLPSATSMWCVFSSPPLPVGPWFCGRLPAS